jgi:hypothetical protein
LFIRTPEAISWITPGASEMLERYQLAMADVGEAFDGELALGTRECKGERGCGCLAFLLYAFWFMTIPTEVVPSCRGMNHAQPDSSKISIMVFVSDG